MPKSKRPALRVLLAPLLLALIMVACAPVPPRVAPPPTAHPPFSPARWEDLPGWPGAQPANAWKGFLDSCQALEGQSAWEAVCQDAALLPHPTDAEVRAFFETHFSPFQVTNPDGSTQGLITGYYEPLLHGSRTRSARYAYPLYGVPPDLLTIDLASVYPALKGLRLRGRLDGRRVVPYYSRSQIDDGVPSLKDHVLFWVDDPLSLFFLQIQGSGRIQLDDGQTVRVGYANQNGYPYRAIGRVLVERGALSPAQASMQGIRQWAKAHPKDLPGLLATNQSYVFFKVLPDDPGGPPGALGVPLTARRSLAVDPKVIPLGAPVFLATTLPGSAAPFDRLMLAQDTGGAIRGAVRADVFFGFGDRAADLAGRMEDAGSLWVLLPNPPQAGIPPPSH
ncbi:MAG: MltA domain-containing protein [Betaproteobacteria bacterium]|nr:MltA domain-containing protein [Betaproteobacteria bacterium]